MDAVEAELGIYQLVDPTWSFAVSCDWQCKPQEEQTTVLAVQPTEAELQSAVLDEKDAELGLYQVVDPSWKYTTSCDWQCKPEDQQLQQQEQRPEGEAPETVDQAAATQPPATTRCSVPLSDSDARLGLYQLVDHRWNYVVSCDWQCKPGRQRKPKTITQAEPSKAEQKPEEKPIESGESLSEADAQLGLYQRVSPKWDNVVSCDWQCKPLHEEETRVTGETETRAADEVPVSEPVPLPESDAQLGLYQLVNPRWNFCISCDWQCRPLGESLEPEPEEAPEHRVEEELISTSSLSTCREMDDVGGEDVVRPMTDMMDRPSLFQQTGDIMMTLVGDEGELGLVEIDEEGMEEGKAVSPDVERDEKEAAQRQRKLRELVNELGDIDMSEVGRPMRDIMYGWALHDVQVTPAVSEQTLTQPKQGKKVKGAKGRKTPESAESAVSATGPVARRLPSMYGWALRSTTVEPTQSTAATPTASQVPASGVASSAVAESSKHSATASASATADQSGAVSVENVCKERSTRTKGRKPTIRYAPTSPCPVVSCGPTKPLRTFREKPDSCLPRRK